LRSRVEEEANGADETTPNPPNGELKPLLAMAEADL
jgi:hypothetical protein